MPDLRYDVLAIGNAIVDVLAVAEDDFLVAEKLAKGTMHLIEADRAETLHRAIATRAVEKSGGSAGNTAAGVASLGGRAAFIGKVAQDPLGDLYRRDMHDTGVDFDTPPLRNGAPTARSMIFITPDGERTMNTYLGACQALGPADIDPEVVGASAVTYLEGYLWDPPEAKKAFVKAADIAHQAGRKVSLTLSDPFCVDRYRGEFIELIRWKTVDILLANDSEVKSLYQTADLGTAVEALRTEGVIAAVTIGADGAIVVTPGGVRTVKAEAVDEVRDLTGAGDLFASGFLFGAVRGIDLAEAARLGNIAAAEVIGHIGPRPATSLKALAAKAGFAL
jgi:sugar/nucleoside kinase (ribokinase family)